MAKRASRKDSEETGSAHFDASSVPDYVERIEALQAEIDEHMQKAKDKCTPLREDISEVKKEAHESGIPRKELNEKIRERRLRSKADAIRENLTPEQQDNFDEMSKALGDLDDTPLGRAAKQRKSEMDIATAH